MNEMLIFPTFVFYYERIMLWGPNYVTTYVLKF